MEHENTAKRGVANTALGLSIGALGTELLTGAFTGLLGGGGARTGCGETQMPVTRYEAAQQTEIERLRTEISLRDSNIYTDQKIAEVYARMDSRLGAVESQIAQQAVYNAANNATLGCIQGQVAQLMGLTKTIIPADNICPPVMPKYNSWTAPTAAATT